jgi:hypothetical protein
MPSNSSLRFDGLGLTNPVKDIRVGSAFVGTTNLAPNGVECFSRTVTITSAAAATPVSILADAEVGTGRKVYVQQVIATVGGATAWATTANVKVQDTNSSPVDFFTMLVAALGANARAVFGSASTTIETAAGTMTGGTAGKGLQVVGNANGTGSTLTVTVTGFIG